MSPLETAPSGAEGRRGAANQKVVVAVLYVSIMFMSILDSTIVNVAIPTLRSALDVGDGAVEWVVTGYLLGLAVTVPIAGWLADRLGMVRLFVGGVVAFSAASAACALSSTLVQLVISRVAQGLSGGLLIPLGLAMLFSVFPPAERARASKILVVPTAVAPAVGPLLGGWLVDHYSWPWIFAVNVPIGVAIAVFGAWALREPVRPEARGPLDVWGCALVGAGTAGLLYALGTGVRAGWTDPTVIAAIVVGVGSWAAFATTQGRSAHPVLDLGLMRERLFRNTTLAMTCSTGAFIGMLFLLPQFLQGVLGVSAFESGLSTFPEALGVLVLSQVTGRLYPGVGPRRLMSAGLAAMAVVVLMFLVLDEQSSLWLVRVLAFALGGCFGFVLVPLQAASFAQISPPEMPRASSLFNTGRQLASATGVAVVAAALSGFGSVVPLNGFRAGFVAAAVIAVIGAVVASRIHDIDAASTMGPVRA